MALAFGGGAVEETGLGEDGDDAVVRTLGHHTAARHHCNTTGCPQKQRALSLFILVLSNELVE